VDISLSYSIKVTLALFQGLVWLEVMRLLMKNRTSYYGRDFCGNVEMECIVNSVLSGKAEYRAPGG
jgi:hypothetical protein